MNYKSADLLRLIKPLAGRGLTQTQIGQRLGVDQTRVSQILVGAGIRSRQTQLHEDIDHSYFASITRETNYWAGFLAADGCVSGNRIRLKIHKRDKSHLALFRNQIGSRHALTSTSNNACSLEYMSREHAQSLRSLYNITGAKSLTLQPPCRRSLDFIAGYFDGDGSLYKCGGQWRCVFVGTKKLLAWIQREFSDLSQAAVSGHSGQCFALPYAGNSLVPTIMSRFYRPSPFHLKRKYTAYKAMLRDTK